MRCRVRECEMPHFAVSKLVTSLYSCELLWLSVFGKASIYSLAKYKQPDNSNSEVFELRHNCFTMDFKSSAGNENIPCIPR